MNKNPLHVIKEKDSDLFDQVQRTQKLALDDHVISKKYKLLMALAIDASHGAVDGVKSLALQAQKHGATKEEIMEAVRVAYFISGVSSVYTAARALDEIL